MAIRKSKEQATVSNAISEIFDISDKIHGYLDDIEAGLITTIVLSVVCIFLFCLLLGVISFNIHFPADSLCFTLLIGLLIFLFSIIGFYSGFRSYSYKNFKWKLDTIVRFRKFDTSPILPKGKTPIDRIINYLKENDGRFADAIKIIEKKPKKKKDFLFTDLSGKSKKEYSYDYGLDGIEKDYFVIKNINRSATINDVKNLKMEIDDFTKNEKMPPTRFILIQQGDEINEDVIEFIHTNWVTYSTRDDAYILRKYEIPIEVISETKDKHYLFGILYFY
jgi:hypothetical protein